MDYSRYFPVFFGIWAILFVSLAARQSRKARAQFAAIFPDTIHDNVRFQDTRASGYSLKNVRTRYGGASNCLEVIVTDRELWIRTSWPVRMIFSGAEFDLLHRTNKATVHIEKRSKRKVSVDFVDSSGEHHELHLELRRMDEFVAAMGTDRTSV